MTDKYKTLCSTLAKRKLLARDIETLASQLGIEIEYGEFDTPKEISMTLYYGPYRVSMSFMGGPCFGEFMGHWYTSPGTACYPNNFGVVIGGSLNTCHYGKATTIEETFDGFKASIRAGFLALKNIM